MCAIIDIMDTSDKGHPLGTRHLTPVEVEQFRLLLSTFCDGSGARVKRFPRTVPDYRDFERVTALMCGGETTENKGIFDVSVPIPGSKPYGISCKMAHPGLVSDPETSFMELSNSASKFASDFTTKGYDWVKSPNIAGSAAVRLVMSWHQEVSAEIDLERSCYFLLTHSNDWLSYKLSSFSLRLDMIEPESLQWETRSHRKTGRPNSIVGSWSDGNKTHRIWEFYPLSGGQLKYFPMWRWATWSSPPFKLEMPPIFNMKDKARTYFPDMWID